MKKFRIYSSLFVFDYNTVSVKLEVESNNYEALITQIETGRGWYMSDNCAFKVAYIEEIID